MLCRIRTFFFFNDTATTEIYTLSLHDALPICHDRRPPSRRAPPVDEQGAALRQHAAGDDLRQVQAPGVEHDRAGHRVKDQQRSEEHTSELQSPCNLVCRLLLEKKKHNTSSIHA